MDLERRTRLRRVVAGVTVVAAIIVVASAGKALVRKHARPRLAPVASVASPPAPPPPAPPPPPVASPSAEAPAPTAMAETKPAATVDTKPAETAAPASSSGPRKDASLVEPKASDPPRESETLKRQVLALLNRGASREAIPLARQAIEADPTDALNYLYLGSALQDTGQRAESIEAYSECVRRATHGPVRECRQLGGRR